MSKAEDFWALRKAAVAAEVEADARRDAAAEIALEQDRFEEMSDAEILTALELPDPDVLVQGDDFSVFLAKAVPEHLRRRALRKLWLSNPVLANVDALVDYGEDFTDSAVVVKGMQTSYQVGKGMLEHIKEMARQAAAEAERDADSAPAEADDGARAEQPSIAATVEPDLPNVAGEFGGEAEADVTAAAERNSSANFVVAERGRIELMPQVRRRMRFEFDQTLDSPEDLSL